MPLPPKLKRSWPILLVLPVVVGLLLIAFSSRKGDQDPAWEHAQTTGVLRVGMDAAYPPFEFVTPENEIAGFDVDLANEIGRRLGFEMQFINMAYDGLYDSLLIGNVDLLVSALVAAPEFEGKADFSVPYFNVGEHLVVPRGSVIGEMGDLEGAILAVEYGSGGDVEAREWERRLPSLTVSRYDDPGGALTAVVDGSADAALVDGITARLGIGEHPELAIADNVNDVLLAVAINEDSRVLKEQVDAAMWEMLNDGTVDALIEKWFGPQN